MNGAENLNDLAAFLAVAQERSFTKAAAKLGVSQSALSQTVRNLEARLGLRLLTRTTRSVAPTEAGERLARTLAPRLEDIDAELAALTELRESRPARSASPPTSMPPTGFSGRARERFLPDYPDIKVEVIIDFGLTDIVAERYDAGVRNVEIIAKDMIAVPIGPQMRMAVVGCPGYFEGRHARSAAGPDRPPLHQSPPADPRRPLRLGVREARPRAARAGRRPARLQQRRPVAEGRTRRHGLAYLPESRYRNTWKGRLVRVLEDWCEPFSGYHLYYPSRRQHAPAFSRLVEALRYRGPKAGS